MSSQAKQTLNDMLKEVTTIMDDDDIEVAVKQERADGSQKVGSTPNRPAVKTPPGSQRASRGGTGVQYGSHPHATPSSSNTRESCKVEDDDFFPESSEDDDKTKVISTPSKKRKTGDTPSKTLSKWEYWEEQIIWKAMIPYGEKGCDWKKVLRDINARRSTTEQRTAKAVSCHWSSMKSKLID
jgi:hypothetical protein